MAREHNRRAGGGSDPLTVHLAGGGGWRGRVHRARGLHPRRGAFREQSDDSKTKGQEVARHRTLQTLRGSPRYISLLIYIMIDIRIAWRRFYTGSGRISLTPHTMRQGAS